MIANLFTYMDVALVAILLIAGIVGAVKGFANQFFSFISLIVIVIVAGCFCEKLAEVMYPVFGESIEKGFADWMLNQQKNWIEAGDEGSRVEIFNAVINWGEVDKSYITEALAILGVPSLVSGILEPVIVPVIKGFGECALIEKLPTVLASWTLNTICFILIVLLAGIVMYFIKRVVFRLLKKPVIGGINRFLGFLVSAVYTYVWLSVVLVILSAILPGISLFTELQNFLIEQSNLSLKGYCPIFHFMYNYNFIGEFIIKQFLMLA